VNRFPPTYKPPPCPTKGCTNVLTLECEFDDNEELCVDCRAERALRPHQHPIGATT